MIELVVLSLILSILLDVKCYFVRIGEIMGFAPFGITGFLAG